MVIQGSGFKNFDMIQLKQVAGAACMNISGHGTMKITDAAGSITEYTPRFMHFKSPSEHCFDKERLDLEL